MGSVVAGGTVRVTTRVEVAFNFFKQELNSAVILFVRFYCGFVWMQQIMCVYLDHGHFLGLI